MMPTNRQPREGERLGLLRPLRLGSDLIWRPSRTLAAPPAQVVGLLTLCGLPLAIGLTLGGSAGGWLVGVLAACVVAGLAMEGLVKEGAALLLGGGLVALTRPPRLVAGISSAVFVPDGARLAAATAACSLLLVLTVGMALLVGRLPWRWPSALVATTGGSVAALLALIIVGMEPVFTAVALVVALLALLPLALGAVGGTLVSVEFLAAVFAVFGAVAVDARGLVGHALLVGLFCAAHVRLSLEVLAARAAGPAPSALRLGLVRRATAPLIALLMVVSAVGGGLLVAGVSVLAVPLFLLVCWFFGLVGLPAFETDWANLLLLLLVPIIAVETHGLAVTGVGMLLVLLGAYRLLPEYALFAAISRFGNRRASAQAARWLGRLPPWSSEHLWLPLPGHAQLLRAALTVGVPLAEATVERMHALAQPGFRRTLRAALVPLVYTSLAGAQGPAAIAACATGRAGLLLDTLVQLGAHHAERGHLAPPPTRIQLGSAAELPWERRRRRPAGSTLELTVVLPGLQASAQLVAAALAAPAADSDPAPNNAPPAPTLAAAHAALERLAGEPALVDPHVAQRWQPVIACWRDALGSAVVTGDGRYAGHRTE